MQRINSESGQFSEGNPATNTKGTVVTAEWFNTIQEEIANVVVEAGIELNANDNRQLAKVIIQSRRVDGITVITVEEE